MQAKEYAQAGVLVQFFQRKAKNRQQRLNSFWGFLAAAGFCFPTALASAPKPVPAKPEFRLPLADLGHPGFSAAFLSAGATVLTVNFADADHLLVTFNTRSLIPRLAEAQPDDQDEIVEAELITIPSGKVAARTRWHLHDHGRYLWSLGNGRFLLRNRELLSTFSPVANLTGGHSFDRVSFPHRRGTIAAVDLSPDNRLVTIQTAAPQYKAAFKPSTAAASGRGPASSSPASAPMINFGDAPPKPDVHIDVYRLAGLGSERDPLLATRSTSLHSNGAVRLPLDDDGYLDEVEKPRNHWSISFYSFGGKALPLAPIDSPCPPDLLMVSRSQYISLMCRGMQGGQVLAAFDLEKHYIWEEPMGVLSKTPFFLFAPMAGRFAITRNSEASGVNDPTTGSPAVTATQEFRVYQTQTGDLLLKVNCDPVFKTPENFDLAPDGMRALVVRGGAIEVFRLPELTAVDRQDLIDLRKVTPPEVSTQVDLRRLLREEEQDAREAAAEASAAATPAAGAQPAGATTPEPVAVAPIPAPTVAAPVPTAVVPAAVSTPMGDAEGPRKPPTLLNPGEKPDFKSKDVVPK